MAIQSIAMHIQESTVPYARQKKFGFEAWHVLEIFTSVLRDEYTFDLDGTHNITILLGARQGHDPYRREVFEGLGHRQVNAYYAFEGFDASEYFTSNETDRTRQIVNVLENALCQLASERGISTEPIKAAARFTHSCGPVATLPAPRVFPWDERRPEAVSASGQFRASLIRQIGRGTLIWGVKVCDASDKHLVTVILPNELYKFKSAGQVFRRAQCTDDTLQLIDENGSTSFQVDLTEAVATAQAHDRNSTAERSSVNVPSGQKLCPLDEEQSDTPVDNRGNRKPRRNNDKKSEPPKSPGARKPRKRAP